MLAAAGRAIAQCFTRGFLWVLAKAFAVTLVLLGFLSWLLIRAIHLIPAMPWDWLNAALSVLATLGVLLAAVLLLAPVAMIVVGVFLDEIAEKVDRRYYPENGPPRRQPVGEVLGVTLGLSLLALVLNVAALPIYIVSPPFAPFVYFVLNGVLIGREYYLLVAARRLAPQPAKALRKQHRLKIFVAGTAIAVLLPIPGVSLFAPLFGTAFMLHLVEAMRAEAALAPDGFAPVPAAGADDARRLRKP
jgi:CysZ protein